MAISAARSLGKWNTPVDMQQKAMLSRPASYITRRKLERAELLLTTTVIPVKNIATELGYDDISYFIRIFRKHSNMSPQEYRNAHQ